MWLNTPTSALTQIKILYTHTDGHKDGWTDTQMDREADSSIPTKTFVLQVYNKLCLWNTNAPAMSIFFLKTLTFILTLTLPDDLEIGTNRKFLSQGILMWNLKALSLTNQKIWPM